MISKEKRYALDIYEAIAMLFDESSDEFKYKLKEVDLTQFFTGSIIALSMFYQRVTGTDGDLLDYLALQTRLTLQYLAENAKGVEKDDK